MTSREFRLFVPPSVTILCPKYLCRKITLSPTPHLVDIINEYSLKNKLCPENLAIFDPLPNVVTFRPSSVTSLLNAL